MSFPLSEGNPIYLVHDIAKREIEHEIIILVKLRADVASKKTRLLSECMDLFRTELVCDTSNRTDVQANSSIDTNCSDRMNPGSDCTTPPWTSSAPSYRSPNPCQDRPETGPPRRLPRSARDPLRAHSPKLNSVRSRAEPSSECWIYRFRSSPSTFSRLSPA